MPQIIRSKNVCAPDWQLQPGMVAIAADGMIESICPDSRTEDHAGQLLNQSNTYLLPSFIDIHTHGGFGVGFGEHPLLDGLQEYSQQVARTGVGGFVMSIAASTTAELLAIVREYAVILKSHPEWPGAIPLGLHLEGPFLNPQKSGAFNPAWIRPLALDDVHDLLDAGSGWIKQVSMAPEMENAGPVAEAFSRAGVVVSLGHSNADYETASAALAGSYSHVTHAFNVQSPLHHRSPGVVGAVLASDSATTELIGDPWHVHPAAMKILYRCLGPDRVVLISDAMPGAGLPDGDYELAGQRVRVHAGSARLADGTLAGSTVTMDACLRSMVNLAGVPLEQAAKMASFNPAKVIGLEKQAGSLTAGKDANLVMLDAELNVVKTWVKGKLMFQREEIEK
jgi:N-acetylglucosamine-6-phosphate deacetylase